ncbi:MAG TPA: DegT/DnrJ/EryC1/StrS family aminotransferase [Candidatus Scalindua sp.]|nr:DegT/DnrJ/EryC1/StrS family aminotransferase [Candidatus Scalindua sp.]
MGKRRINVGDFHIGREEREAITEVLDSGRISEGTKVREFERRWAEYVGTKYCIATSSGAGALICTLTALKYYKNLKEGTKVITTPLTYIADSSALTTVGFEPQYVDVDPVTFAITPQAIEAHLRKAPDLENYGLILPIDLMGYPVKIDEINQIAEKYGLSVLEDSAQAHGTLYKGKKTGSGALLGIFSFYIAHNIQAGEMGAVVTNDPELSRLVRKIKAQGRACDCLVCTRSRGYCPQLEAYQGEDDFDPRFTHDLIGYNFKTMEFQPALALTQIRKVDEIIAKRQRNVRYLNTQLKEYQDILQLPLYSDEISYLAYPLIIKKPGVINRKELRRKLEEAGIETRPLFGCIPTQQPAYGYLREEYKDKLPHADYIGKNGFYIGCHQYLEEQDLEYIVEVFQKILRHRNY